MAQFDVHDIQFLDLSDWDEEQRKSLLDSLRKRDNPKVQVPWDKVKKKVTVPEKITQFCHEPVYNCLPVLQPGPPPPQQCYVSPPIPVVPPVTLSVYSTLPYGAPPTMIPVNTFMMHPGYSYPPPNLYPGHQIAICPPAPETVPPQPQMPPAAPALEIIPAQVLPPPQQEQNFVNSTEDVNSNNTELIKVNGVTPTAEEETPKETNGTTSPTPQPAAPPAPKSWASLLKKPETNNTNHIEQQKVETVVQNELNTQQTQKMNANVQNPNYYRMAEFFEHFKIDPQIRSLQPRGLINLSNYCYINSILQALLACPPFYNLFYSLAEAVSMKDNRKHTQIIDNMIRFIKEFKHLPAGQRINRRLEKNAKNVKEVSLSVNCDKPFEPSWIYKMFFGMRSDSFVVEGRQEDAEEFLGMLLNRLNDEMLEVMKMVNGEEESNVYNNNILDDDNWQVIGPKNKGSVTRRTEVVRTPISDIFGGNIRSRLHRAGDQVTDNIQPFFTLQLNIEKVNTVREALEALVSKNQLEGVTSSKTNEEVEAWQQVTIEELPIVLVLHLKCFDFKLDGCTKICKPFEFGVDLKIDSKLLSKSNYQAKEKQYKLFAVVYHDGKEATKGHYITDAYHVGYASWLRYDDAGVKPVTEEQVLKPHGTKMPYLLFYRRCDTVRSK